MGQIYFGGIPTEPDIAKLREAYGTPPPGLIPYQDIERIIGVKRNTCRFKTVVRAWRRLMFRECNVDMKADPGKGLIVLTEPERVGVCQGDMMQASRRVMKGYRRTVMIQHDKLDAVSKTKHDHLVRHGLAIATACTVHTREYLSDIKSPAQIPRLIPSGAR